jgi:putative transposon-encoded protein
MAKKIRLDKGKFSLSDDVEMIFEKTITRFGTGAKIDAPKEFIGKKVYVLIRKK